MKITSLLAALSLAHLGATETVTFDIYFGANNQCIENPSPGLGNREVVGTDDCRIYSYTNPSGDVKTNSEDLFNCCENFIEFVQYAGADVCGDPKQGKWIYNVQSTVCHAVETSSGPTWQILTNYTRCSARYNYNGYAGSTITEEQCNDPNFMPEAGSWEMTDKVAPPSGGVPEATGTTAPTNLPATSKANSKSMFLALVPITMMIVV